MRIHKVLTALVRRCPRRDLWAYFPAVGVLCLFAAMGWGDEGILVTMPYLLLLLLCLAQFLYTTILGWALLFGAFAAYTITVVATLHSGTLTDYLFFSFCGAVPAIFLFFARPWKVSR